MRRVTALICVCAAILPGDFSRVVGAEEGGYFPDLVFHKDKERNGFLVKWYSKHLRAMKEPSLWTLSKTDPSATVFRLLWLPSFDRPISVRIVKSKDSIVVHVIELDGAGGFAPGKVAVDKTMTLRKGQWEEFQRLVDAAKFWALPTTSQDGDRFDDGAQLILEGVQNGSYHVADRMGFKEDSYLKLCRYVILDLSGLDVHKTWNGYHK